MFAYCLNNPVEYEDRAGNDPVWSLENDWAGREILFHWLYGGGEDYIVDDKRWGDYMRANELMNQQIVIIVDTFAGLLKNGISQSIDYTTSAEIENGESIIGYQYLHGTNADVGGFHVVGTISKNYFGDVTYELTCTWNDMIDPNFKYTSDQKKAALAQWIPFADPTDYYIAITWTVSGTMRTGIGGGGGRVVAALR